jgi:RNA methyltransferase, TrmH family
VLSKSQIKYINSLKLKKFREIHRQFIAEGTKIVNELIASSLMIDTIFSTNPHIAKKLSSAEKFKFFVISEGELQKISNLDAPNEALAIVNIPEKPLNIKSFKDELVLMLDSINDPGNLGTIIRIADWFGINNIICSNNCVDAYNSKVVQATMGSIARVNIFYNELETVLSSVDSNINIYGALLNAESIYKKQLSDMGIIIIGNESRGISAKISGYINQPISIPSFPDNPMSPKAESLNVSVATGIICAEFRRQ